MLQTIHHNPNQRHYHDQFRQNDGLLYRLSAVNGQQNGTFYLNYPIYYSYINPILERMYTLRLTILHYEVSFPSLYEFRLLVNHDGRQSQHLVPFFLAYQKLFQHHYDCLRITNMVDLCEQFQLFHGKLHVPLAELQTLLLQFHPHC